MRTVKGSSTETMRTSALFEDPLPLIHDIRYIHASKYMYITRYIVIIRLMTSFMDTGIWFMTSKNVDFVNRTCQASLSLNETFTFHLS